ncbi:hypothetical protein F383_16650 [Gossypium arboreum]|uniref:Uncharacterized protein n=1 Tax=Gossypium arboreum TaxID=29729 RepID=A0A0B0NIZ0_GOSAR|nr:hypothetical protein F383_16650 [Gossypium arboreum]
MVRIGGGVLPNMKVHIMHSLFNDFCINRLE